MIITSIHGTNFDLLKGNLIALTINNQNDKEFDRKLMRINQSGYKGNDKKIYSNK